MEIAEVLELLTKMRDRGVFLPERDALTVAIEYIHSYDVWQNGGEIKTAVESERERLSEGIRSWLVSKISDDELCKIISISKYDWNILIQEKQATWNSYIGSLVDACDNPNCKVKQALKD